MGPTQQLLTKDLLGDGPAQDTGSHSAQSGMQQGECNLPAIGRVPTNDNEWAWLRLLLQPRLCRSATQVPMEQAQHVAAHQLRAQLPDVLAQYVSQHPLTERQEVRARMYARLCTVGVWHSGGGTAELLCNGFPLYVQESIAAYRAWTRKPDAVRLLLDNLKATDTKLATYLPDVPRDTLPDLVTLEQANLLVVAFYGPFGFIDGVAYNGVEAQTSLFLKQLLLDFPGGALA